MNNEYLENIYRNDDIMSIQLSKLREIQIKQYEKDKMKTKLNQK